MRVTESALISFAGRSVSEARERAGRAGAQLSDGVRVHRASDDPTAWAEGARASARNAISQGRGQAIARANDRLKEQDAALADLGDAFSRAGELVSQLSNGVMNADDRASGAAELRQLRARIAAAGNAESSDRENLFDPAVAAREIEAGPGQRVSVSVASDVLTLPNGEDALAVFDRIAAAFEANDPATARADLDVLRAGGDRIATMRSDAGTRLAALESADDARRQFELNLAETRAKNIEADPIAAATELASASVALEGARAAAEQILAIARPSR